jgi:hypothetical protein
MTGGTIDRVAIFSRMPEGIDPTIAMPNPVAVAKVNDAITQKFCTKTASSARQLRRR